MNSENSVKYQGEIETPSLETSIALRGFEFRDNKQNFTIIELGIQKDRRAFVTLQPGNDLLAKIIIRHIEQGNGVIDPESVARDYQSFRPLETNQSSDAEEESR